MVTEILSAAIANTTTSTAATQNGLDIGDITGIVALVATAITFALTYRHGTQSEQTRIARETWEKISESNHKFNEILEQYKQQQKEMLKQEEFKNTDAPYYPKDEYNISDTKNELNRICEILFDQLDYYGFLVKHKQIKEKFTSYYTYRVLKVYLQTMDAYKEWSQIKHISLDYAYLYSLNLNYIIKQRKLEKEREKYSKESNSQQY
jgi:hypothetical protein